MENKDKNFFDFTNLGLLSTSSSLFLMILSKILCTFINNNVLAGIFCIIYLLLAIGGVILVYLKERKFSVHFLVSLAVLIGGLLMNLTSGINNIQVTI